MGYFTNHCGTELNLMNLTQEKEIYWNGTLMEKLFGCPARATKLRV